MVAKISHGASLYGALSYNHEKVFQGTAEILSGHRMISDRPGLPSGDMRLALLSFENHLTANRRTDKPVLHINPAKRNVLDLKNETCKNREKRNVLKISHTRYFKAIKKQSVLGCFYSF